MNVYACIGIDIKENMCMYTRVLHGCTVYICMSLSLCVTLLVCACTHTYTSIRCVAVWSISLSSA